jgi:hypothetical protein
VKPLSEQRDQVVIIRDDLDAKVLLVELGIFEKFSKRGDLAESWAQILTYSDHPTHWIIATWFTGSDDPVEDGFDIACYPKSLYSESMMDVVLAKFSKQIFPQGVAPKFSDSKPTHN